MTGCKIVDKIHTFNMACDANFTPVVQNMIIIIPGQNNCGNVPSDAANMPAKHIHSVIHSHVFAKKEVKVSRA